MEELNLFTIDHHHVICDFMTNVDSESDEDDIDDGLEDNHEDLEAFLNHMDAKYGWSIDMGLMFDLHNFINGMKVTRRGAENDNRNRSWNERRNCTLVLRKSVSDENARITI